MESMQGLIDRGPEGLQEALDAVTSTERVFKTPATEALTTF